MRGFRASENPFAPVDASRGDPLVDAADLETYYDDGLFSETPVKAVDGVDLTVHRGETLGLVGESGCGKSTLGRTLARLEIPTGGRITFDGRDVSTLADDERAPWHRHCQMVFQDPDSSLDERMTVGEIVREPLDVHDWEDAETRRERVLRLLDAVGLDDAHYARYPHQFSGGQRQRVAIARALALEPDFLVLDEPTSALDVSVQAQILGLLDDLQAEFDLTYLLIAHDLAVVRNVCDRVAVMYLGEIVERGPTDAIFNDPRNPYTRALLSAVPEPDPSASWDRTPLRGSPPNPRHPPSGCRFATRCPHKIRPDDVSLDDAAWAAIDAFRDVLRSRAHRDVSLTERARRLLGRRTERDIETVRADLFEGVALDGADATAVEEAVERCETDGPAAAERRLRERFGSVCDDAPPTAYAADAAGHASRCHRHDAAYSEPGDRRSGVEPEAVSRSTDDD